MQSQVPSPFLPSLPIAHPLSSIGIGIGGGGGGGGGADCSIMGGGMGGGGGGGEEASPTPSSDAAMSMPTEAEPPSERTFEHASLERSRFNKFVVSLRSRESFEMYSEIV